ncbi:hypothetical protein H0H92_005020 [Tricholoma furcatifolium]|nr:hypothetical protein H0H92_005020 [Tricholoma furcatifolium]
MLYKLFVVPRVDVHASLKLKRKKTAKQKGKETRRTQAPRIPLQRLDIDLMSSIGCKITDDFLIVVDPETRKKRSIGPGTHMPPKTAPPHHRQFKYNGNTYIDGYLQVVSRDHYPTVPTKDELQRFKDLSLIPSSTFLAMEELVDTLRLNVGDPVKITRGEAMDAVGEVLEVNIDTITSTHVYSTVTVALEEGTQVQVSLNSLRKTLAVGDLVSVQDGLHQGSIGWVVSISGNTVNLFDDRTAEGMEVAAHQVAFYQPPKTIYTKTRPDTLQAPVGFHTSRLRMQDISPPAAIKLPSLEVQNPHQRFVGRHVQIIKGHFKDYVGIVKNTERDDWLNIELHPTLKKVHFKMDDIALLGDPELRPLSRFAGPSLPLFAPPIERMAQPTPLSIMPLVPSTPLPEGTSAAIGRAWNPSSRTPNPNSWFPCNSYMDCLLLNENLRVHVILVGTKPMLRDPGWKAGDWEGKRGLWSRSDNTEPGYANVRIGMRLERIPEQYISPTNPSIKSQRVIVIDSTDRARYCHEFFVVKYIADKKECILRPMGNTTDLSLRFKLPASFILDIRPIASFFAVYFAVYLLVAWYSNSVSWFFNSVSLLVAWYSNSVSWFFNSVSSAAAQTLNRPKITRPHGDVLPLHHMFTRFRLKQADLDDNVPVPPPSYTPRPGPSRFRTVKNLPKLPKLTFVNHGHTLQQPNFLPHPFGTVLPSVLPPDHDNPFIDPPESPNPFDLTRHQQKRANQWQRWQIEVLPAVVSALCTCSSPRIIEVILVNFDSLERISIALCPCVEGAPRQLLQRGYFACAPVFPSLAVHLKVLDFASELFVNIAPNTTAWCKAVEAFLDRQGYRLSSEGSLRRRFSNCLLWYNALKDATADHAQTILGIQRETRFSIQQGITLEDLYDKPEPFSSPLWRPTDVPPSPKLQTPRPASKLPMRDDEDDIQPQNPFLEAPLRVRPSNYLRSRCPLCFGGNFSEEHQSKRPDAIVCIDACFTQKRNRRAGVDPPLSHPRTVFLPEEKVKSMERYVEALRGAKTSDTGKRRKLNTIIEDDRFEKSVRGSLRVPKSVLDGCEESFTAADSRRIKASTQFFDETALMGVLCRHDIVLFLASMRSSGEKQHYAIALIEELFQHLPPDFRIGLLYDIGWLLVAPSTLHA